MHTAVSIVFFRENILISFLLYSHQHIQFNTMELRYRSNYDFSPSRSHHTSTPLPRLDDGTTLIMSRFSATPNSNKQIQGGVHNNTFTNSPNQGRPAASTSNWRQSLDRILRKFVFLFYGSLNLYHTRGCSLLFQFCQLHQGRPFSTYVKFSEKRIFLTPRYAHLLIFPYLWLCKLGNCYFI